jgi:hypothetical protein
MTPDAALDRLAFGIGLRLMGADARRRLRTTLLRHPEATDAPQQHRDALLERLDRIDAMLSGRLQPETMQDRLDVARAERERAAPPFDGCFWLGAVADLIGAGFRSEEAARLVNEVRRQVDPLGAARTRAEEESGGTHIAEA